MTSVSTDSPQSTLGRSNNYPSEKENDSGGSSLNLSKKASKRLLKQINNMPQSSPPASNYPSVTLVLTSSDAGANASNKAAVIKTIDLFENNPVKIGRQTNSKTVPSLSNGFFDSKVLSRNHAEIWVEGGKIYIKDTKSSNGTFVNGKRLSEENHESAPVELKNGDTVDFGIDIVGDDGSTLLYKRVTVKASVIGSNEKPNMETASPAAALNLSQSQANALYKIDDRAIARDFKGEARSYIPVSESKLNASNRSELTNITGSLQTQVSKAKQTSQDLDHLKSAFNQINETVSSLASATSAPNQIVPSPNDLMKQLELLKSQIQGVQTKVASLENSGGSATSNELKKEFEKYQSNMKALEKQMAELTSEVMGVKESSSQTAELTLSVSQSTANLPQLTNEVEKLNGTISELQKEKEFLESEVEVVKKLARVVNEELDEMKLENKKLKGIVEDLEGWKKSVAKDMEVVEKERKEVKQSLNELKKHTRRPRRSFLSTLFFTLSTTFLVSSLSFYVVKYTPLPSYVESKTGLKMQGVVDRMDQVVGAVVGGLAGGIGSVVGQWESSQAGTVGGNGAWVREKQNVNSDESVDGDSNAGKASKKVKVKGNKNDQGSTSKEAVVEQVKVEL